MSALGCSATSPTTGDTAVAPGPEVDVTDPALLAADLQAALPDVVYHLAALTHVGQSWSEPAETFRVNADRHLEPPRGRRRAARSRPSSCS